MMTDSKIQRIAVVGTGVIGMSWVAYFLEKGLHVTATDVSEGAEQKLRDGIRRIAPHDSQDLLRFEKDLEMAVKDAQFVQENGPERVPLKQDLFKRLDAYTSPEVLLVSSSSGVIPTIFQAEAAHPERILLGHPFNPPHLIPLVEVCGGEKTSPEAIRRTIAFYEAIGKKPIHLKKEIAGHVANRLQAALWQEAFNLVQQGVASVKDVDTAISEGPGLRWALLGPFLNLHLSGGDAGIRHTLEHLGPPMETWMRDLGKVSIDENLINQITDGVNEWLCKKDLPQLIAERDNALRQIEQWKRQTKELK